MPQTTQEGSSGRGNGAGSGRTPPARAPAATRAAVSSTPIRTTPTGRVGTRPRTTRWVPRRTELPPGPHQATKATATAAAASAGPLPGRASTPNVRTDAARKAVATPTATGRTAAHTDTTPARSSRQGRATTATTP